MIMKDTEYGRDPYLDGLKVRLANKLLNDDLFLDNPNQYVAEAEDLKKQIRDLLLSYYSPSRLILEEFFNIFAQYSHILFFLPSFY